MTPSEATKRPREKGGKKPWLKKQGKKYKKSNMLGQGSIVSSACNQCRRSHGTRPCVMG